MTKCMLSRVSFSFPIGWGNSRLGDVTHPRRPTSAPSLPAFICFLVSLLIFSRNYYNLSAPPLILATSLLQHKGDRLQQIRKIIPRNPFRLIFAVEFLLETLNNDGAVNRRGGHETPPTAALFVVLLTSLFHRSVGRPRRFLVDRAISPKYTFYNPL